MIKAVLFDFDDTLVKTKEIRYKALKEAGRRFYKLTITDEEIDRQWGKPFNPFLEGVFRNIDKVERLFENYVSIIANYPNEPFEGTKEVLVDLSRKFLMGIISSSNPELIERGLDDVNIDSHLFFEIQSSKDTKVHKPDPKVFSPIIRKLRMKNIRRDDILYVGDSIDDYEAGTKAGFSFCGISDRTVKEAVFIDNNIPYIHQINELPDYIFKID